MEKYKTQKIDIEKNHSRKLRENIRGRRNQTEIDLQVYQNKKNGVRFFWERRASERERERALLWKDGFIDWESFLGFEERNTKNENE